MASLSPICVAGDMYEIGADSGRHYSVNVPLKEGIDDDCQCFYTCKHRRLSSLSLCVVIAVSLFGVLLAVFAISVQLLHSFVTCMCCFYLYDISLLCLCLL